MTAQKPLKLQKCNILHLKDFFCGYLYNYVKGSGTNFTLVTPFVARPIVIVGIFFALVECYLWRVQWGFKMRFSFTCRKLWHFKALNRLSDGRGFVCKQILFFLWPGSPFDFLNIDEMSVVIHDLCFLFRIKWDIFSDTVVFKSGVWKC